MATIATTPDGFRFIQRGPETDDHLAMGGHEADLQATLYGLAEETDPESVVVVVGAHVGLWAIRLTQFRDVVAYEANPATAATLVRNRDLNLTAASAHSLTVWPLAVWDTGGDDVATVDVNDKAEGGSTRVEPYTKPGETVQFEISDAPPQMYYNVHRSTTVTLDHEFPDQGRSVGLVVIDVEGAEARVLRGARKILERDKPTLVIEVHEGHPGTDGDLREQLDGVLHEAGYEWFSINLTGERYIARHSSKMPDYDMSIYDPVNLSDAEQ